MLSDVLHQDESVRFLRRVIDGAITNPLLLLGAEGVGRRYAALQVTKELFCSGTRTLGCTCIDCVQLDQRVHPDLFQLTPQDGKDIGVDAARSMLDAMSVFPSQCAVRVFILDGADRLTSPAANALLKTLEEPPTTARIFLLAESAKLVLPTIRSRCGVLNFHSLPESFVRDQVSRFESDATKALVYARLSAGSVGRAIQYWGSGRLTLRDKALSLLSAALAKDVASVFSMVDQIDKELLLALRFLDTLVHDMLMLSVDTARIINLDLIATLTKLKSSKPDCWGPLHEGIEATLLSARSTKIQLGFHVKSLLLETFGGV